MARSSHFGPSRRERGAGCDEGCGVTREAATHRLSIRIDLAGGGRIGPGKIALLEQIGSSGSISAAGRAMRMSYRRAWELVEDLNRTLGYPVVATMAGGVGGGGARLTEAGRTLVAQYRAMERAAAAIARDTLPALPAGAPPPDEPAGSG